MTPHLSQAFLTLYSYSWDGWFHITTLENGYWEKNEENNMTYQCIVDCYLVLSWVTQHHDVDSAISAMGLDSVQSSLS
jgi:hypothetical protein